MLHPDCSFCGAHLMVRIGWWGDQPIYVREPCSCPQARQQRKATVIATNDTAA